MNEKIKKTFRAMISAALAGAFVVSSVIGGGADSFVSSSVVFAEETNTLEPGKYVAELYRSQSNDTSTKPDTIQAYNDFAAQALLEVKEDYTYSVTLGIQNWSLYDSFIVLDQSYLNEYNYSNDYVPDQWLDKYELYTENEFRTNYGDYIYSADDSMFLWNVAENIEYDTEKDVAYITVPIEDYAQPIYEMSWTHTQIGANQTMYHEGSYLWLNLDSLIDFNQLKQSLENASNSSTSIDSLKLHSREAGSNIIQFSSASVVSALFSDYETFVENCTDNSWRLKCYINYSDNFAANYKKPYLFAEMESRDYSKYPSDKFAIDDIRYWSIFPTATPNVEYAATKLSYDDWASTFKDITLSSDETGTFLLVDFNELDLIYGKNIHFNCEVYNKRKKKYYNVSHAFTLCPTIESFVHKIELSNVTSDGTSITVLSDSTQIPDGCRLNIIENPEKFNSRLNVDIFSEKKWFTVQIIDENGNVLKPSGMPTIIITLPEDYSNDDYELFVYVENGSLSKRDMFIGTTDKVDETNKTWTRSKIDNVSNYTYAICKYNKSAATNVNTLADGIYSINATLYKNGYIGTVSMSNACLKRNAYLVKTNDKINFYFKANSLDGNESEFGFYIGEFHLDDADLWNNTRYTNFLSDANGELVSNATYDPYTEYANILGGIINMNQSCWNDEDMFYRMTVQSPVMAKMGNLSYEEVKDDEIKVLLQFSNEKLLTSDVTDDNIKSYIIDKGYGYQPSALLRKIRQAEIINNIGAKTVNAGTAFADAYTVYNKADATSQEIEAAINALDATATDKIPSAKVTGYSLTAKEDFGLHLFVDLGYDAQNDANAAVKFNIGGTEQTIAVSDATFVEGKGYEFVLDVPAKKMYDDITAEIVLSEGAEVIGDANLGTYSVAGYLNDYLADSTKTELDALAQATLTYGAYADKFFNGSTDAELADVSAVTIDDVAQYKHNINVTEEGIDFVGAALTLESKTSVKLYFKVDEENLYDITDFAFTVNGNKAEPERNGDYYYITVPKLTAGELAKAQTFTVNDAEFTYSPFSYVYAALADSDAEKEADLINLVKALYLYGVEAGKVA